MKISKIQREFLQALSKTEGYATYMSDEEWTMPDKSTFNISRTEAEELVKAGLIGNHSAFNHHIIWDDWWLARITDAGRALLEGGTAG